MTVNEQAVVDLSKKMMPAQFLTRITDDTIILAFLNLVLAEINWTPPITSLSMEALPAGLNSIVAMGGQVYSTLFLQAGYGLDDFSYSDGGLSLTLNRTSQLSSVYTNMYTNYTKMVTNIKKIYALKTIPRAVSTPQFNTIFAQYLSSIFPGTFPMR